MNEQLAVNILTQFDSEINIVMNNGLATGCLTLEQEIDLQDKLEKIIKQRRDSVDYIKQQIKGCI